MSERPPSIPPADRRAHPRCALELWVDEITGNVTYYQRTANVSPGGMYLSGTVPHPPGTQVRVEFSLPGNPERFRLNGVVVDDQNGDKLGMRVRFIDVPADVAARLSEALAHIGVG